MYHFCRKRKKVIGTLLKEYQAKIIITLKNGRLVLRKKPKIEYNQYQPKYIPKTAANSPSK